MDMSISEALRTQFMMIIVSGVEFSSLSGNSVFTNCFYT